MATVQVDVLPSGVFGHHLEAGHRFGRAVFYARRDPGANGYARPIEHLIAFIDLDTLERARGRGGRAAADPGGRRRVPRRVRARPHGPAADRDHASPRASPSPWRTASCTGIAGRWCSGVDPQEGLVLRDVRFDERPLLYRASCAEMIVPYGEPDPMHDWRTYFDAGEYGLGACMNSLELGCDCVGEITYLDAHLADDSGGVRTIANAICVHEEDAGILWKHSDDRAGGGGDPPGPPPRRQRDDDRRQLRVRVSLVLRPRRDDRDGGPAARDRLHDGPRRPPRRWARTSSTPGLAAPHHQHLFCFRLDLDVDGTANRVREVESERGARRPRQPRRQRISPAQHASCARSWRPVAMPNDGRSRSWLVQSTGRRNGHGSPTAYRLVPGHGTATTARPSPAPAPTGAPASPVTRCG